MASQGQAAAPAGSRPAPPLPAEIGFLASYGIPPELLHYAAALAVITGVHADEILIRHDLLPEDAFYRALARELEVPFERAPRLGRSARYPHSILAGLVPHAQGDRFVAAPRGDRIARLLASRSLRGSPLVITTPTALAKAVFRSRGRTIADEAAYGLPERAPGLSISRGACLGQLVGAASLAAPLSFLLTLAPGTAGPLVGAALGLLFLGMVLLRLATVLCPAPVQARPAAARAPDAALPVYTVIVALHRERRVVARLIAALKALDYPAAKLDIKLVLEADDVETRLALSRLDLPAFIEVLVAPPGLPRTKPRALNVALGLARGRYTAIYDAEDVPDPGQLRLAVATFARAPPEVGCLQARLTIDNTDDSWLTRFFTIEYAALFDVTNPGLAALGAPIPLGGTSNHFRTAVLQEIGGWDAWNVTEDADIGIRLARLGYRTGDLPSTTHEEAPLRLRAWMAQRTRWMKGFMQTCITHSRAPLETWRQLGTGRFAGAVTMTFGTVASALGYPFFAALCLWDLAAGPGARESLARTLWSFVSLTVFVLGLAAMLVPALVALRRRRLWRLVWLVPLLPLYYALVSVAAWRAVWELTRDPFRWNKTEHGSARTSRSRTLTDGGGGRGAVAPDRPAPSLPPAAMPEEGSGRRLTASERGRGPRPPEAA
ncbi:MAG TPA: glycosyltransferase family 2 protein [Microvirga sp.]|nr:glycosyltransferase family 2 protein [Microvirga sp.]